MWLGDFFLKKIIYWFPSNSFLKTEMDKEKVYPNFDIILM